MQRAERRGGHAKLGGSGGGAGDFQKNQEGDNTKFQKVFRDAVRAINRELGKTLTPKQERQLHDAITKQGFDFNGIVEQGVAMFGRR